MLGKPCATAANFARSLANLERERTGPRLIRTLVLLDGGVMLQFAYLMRGKPFRIFAHAFEDAHGHGILIHSDAFG
jgi:hypothetical protein